MGFLSPVVAAAAAGRTVRAANFVRFDFASQIMRIWAGAGPLVAGGETWLGIGQLGKITGLEAALGGAAPEVTFTLLGVDPGLISTVINGPEEIASKPVRVYVQFFADDWSRLGAPLAVWGGSMDTIKATVRHDVATVEVTAETLFTRRGTPPYGWLSDSSQRGLFPGDFGLAMLSSIPFKSTPWPAW